MHSHTYSGNPLGCRAALAVQSILKKESILEKAAVTATRLTALMNEAFGDHQHVGEIRHIGLIHALELVEDRDTKKGFPSEKRVGYQIYRRALEKGLLLRPLGNVLYFNPPLIISEKECGTAVSVCAESIKEILFEKGV